MSVGIATMGMFAPQPCGGMIVEVDSGGGGSYGFEKQKPVVVVDSVYDSDDDLRIRILKVTEWS